MPPTGLILDVRGNGGGYINFGERILQLLTPKPIVPEPFHFLSTALTHGMASANGWLAQWSEPIGQAIETGASFSQGFPLTAQESCNDVGQIYQGPVVLVTDALCYSTTDIFVAGFQDHNIGITLGVHGNTGAGGANVVDHSWLQGTPINPANPFRALPQGAGMRTAFRRSTRLGLRSGVPLEDLGAVPDVRQVTRNDVLDHNIDLIAAAAAILAGMEKQLLRLTRVGDSSMTRFTAEFNNLDRIDVLIDGRTILSQDVTSGIAELELGHSIPVGASVVGYGYRGGILAAATRFST